jgi:hypothetical protein
LLQPLAVALEAARADALIAHGERSVATRRQAGRKTLSAAAVARHYWGCVDASIFMKIRRVFATNTGKIANRAFKPVC